MSIHSLTDFDAVLAIGSRGSFRAAALDLGMSTSALSNAIANLEGQLGVRLFNRATGYDQRCAVIIGVQVAILTGAVQSSAATATGESVNYQFVDDR